MEQNCSAQALSVGDNQQTTFDFLQPEDSRGSGGSLQSARHVTQSMQTMHSEQLE